MFRPLRNKILVKPIERAASDKLVVVTSDKHSLGEVVAVGPKANDAQPGDLIRFGTADNYLTFPEYVENGTRYLVMSEDDVCWIEQKAA